jgi:hypothetical protein
LLFTRFERRGQEKIGAKQSLIRFSMESYPRSTLSPEFSSHNSMDKLTFCTQESERAEPLYRSEAVARIPEFTRLDN